MQTKHEALILEAIKRRSVDMMTQKAGLQDAFGMSSYDDLATLYEHLSEGDRPTFTWLSFTVLSYDMAVAILRVTVMAAERRAMDAEVQRTLWQADKQRQAAWDALAKADAELTTREFTFQEGKRTYWRRLRDLRREVESLRLSVRNLRGYLNAAQAREDRYRRRLAEVAALTDALKTVRELSANLE